MKVQFRPSQDWPQWRPDAAGLRALVDIASETWGAEAVSLDLVRPQRTDKAENAQEASELLDNEAALGSAIRLNFYASGDHEEVVP